MRTTIVIFILIQTFLFAVVDKRLQNYQIRYSLCKGKTDLQISHCLLNGNLNYSRFRGDRSAYVKVSKREIQKVVRNGEDIYEYTMDRIPQTKRYTGLKAYLDYLYSIREKYTPPQFKGDDAEDIRRIKRVLNLLHSTDLEENSDYTFEFETEVLEYQRRQGLEVDGKIGPYTKRALKRPLSSIIRKVKKNLVL